jgi:hypothetical protein
MTRTRFRNFFIAFSVSVALAGFVSCSSSDQAPGEGRIEHPDPGAKAPPTPTSLASPPEPTSGISEPPEHPGSPSEVGAPTSGFTRTPLDKVIAEDKPARAWSKNVPKRRCTDDSECGDGFCDRGSCAAIWTWRERYGQRCELDRWCAGYLCIDGRCRSCASDEECTRTRSWQSNPKCESTDEIPNAHECFGVVGSGPINVSPGPPPQKLKQ